MNLVVKNSVGDQNRPIKHTKLSSIHSGHGSSGFLNDLCQTETWASIEELQAVFGFYESNTAYLDYERVRWKAFTRTPAAMSHGFRRYSQYASAIPSATWHMSTAAAPSLLTPFANGSCLVYREKEKRWTGRRTKHLSETNSLTRLTSVNSLNKSMLVLHASSCSYPNPVIRSARST